MRAPIADNPAADAPFIRPLSAIASRFDETKPDPPPAEPSDPEEAPAAQSDLKPTRTPSVEVPSADDDAWWDVFLPEDDERDPLPDLRDFWISGSVE